MGKVVVGMTMSLDGFINDRDGGVQAGIPISANCEIPSRSRKR